MKPLLTPIVCALIVSGVTSLLSCHKDNQVGSLPVKAPVANAGSDQSFTQAPDSIVLDGRASRSDGRIVKYRWTRIAGPGTIAISDEMAALTTVKSIVTGTIDSGVYEFELQVTDNNGLMSRDTIAAFVNSLPTSLLHSPGCIIFQDLTWKFWSDAMGDEIYITVNPLPAFSIAFMASKQVQVCLQLDTSSAWINVPKWDWYGNYNPPPANDGYIWSFPWYPYSTPSYFLIENYPLNYQLLSRRVKVKVLF